MRVDLANNTSEFGALGQVTLVSKSGTNQLHGSAFDYYSTAGLNAAIRWLFPQFVCPALAGASIGGPVSLPRIYNGKNKSFSSSPMKRSRAALSRTSKSYCAPSVMAGG